MREQLCAEWCRLCRKDILLCMPVYHPGRAPCCTLCLPPYTPGYTYCLARHDHRVYTEHARDGVSTLAGTVAELSVTDGRLTVARLTVRHVTVRHCSCCPVTVRHYSCCPARPCGACSTLSVRRCACAARRCASRQHNMLETVSAESDISDISDSFLTF